MSRLDESSSAKPKTWADLLDTETYTKSKKSFLLLRVIGQKNISKKKLVEYFQDEGVEIPPVIIDIKDGMLVLFQSDEEAWPFRSKSGTIQVDDVKLRVFPKAVPPLHENAFIVKVEDCNESDLKAYFKQFHQKNQPQPVIQSLPQKDCFSVIYKSEAADVSKIKKSLKKIPFKGKHLMVKPFCRTDCIRVTKLKDDATDDEIREGCKKHGHYRITYIEKATKKSAFLYFANYEDAEDLIKKTSATSKIKVGDFDANVSLYYHPETIIETPEAASTSTRQSSTRRMAAQFPSQPSTSAAAKSSTSPADAGRGKDRPRASNGNSSSSAADLILVPCVPHGVLELVMQLPEPNDELKKEFEREGTVSFVPKQIFSVKGDLFHYVVRLKFNESGQNASNAAGRDGQKFEAELQKRLDRFFEQFSSESEEFDTYRLKLLRSEFGWDRDSDLLAIALDADNMVQVHVRWNDMKEGNVTVSGYKSQVGKVLKKLKDVVAKQEIPSYSGFQQRKSQNHQEREPPVVEHSLDQCRPVIRHIDALCQESEEWKLMSSAVQCAPNESYTSFKVKGRPKAVAEAMQWLEAESMKLVTTRHDVKDQSLCEFLRGEKIAKIVSEVEQETKCFIEIETTEPNDEWGGNRMLEPRQSGAKVRFNRKLRGCDVNVQVVETDITRHQCDAIVNASNKELELRPAGVSGSILNKDYSGSIQTSMTKHWKKYGNLAAGEAMTTTAGNLKYCKKVIHAVGPTWYTRGRQQNHFQQSSQDLQRCVKQCLLQAEKHELSSIAIPAISCGVFGGDVETCTSLIVGAIDDYFRTTKTSRVTRIDLVELTDQKTLMCFEKALVKLSAPSADQRYNGQPVTSQPQRQTPTASSRSGRIGCIDVIVKHGDLTREDADMVINPTGTTYDVTASQVGKALVAKGGKSIIDDCRAKRPSSWSLITPDFIVTTGGRLACRKIIHMPIEFNDRPEKFFPKLEKIFSEGEKLRMRSMALPAIGTGTLAVDARKCARMTLTAIENVAKKSLKYLREIRIVIFDRALVETFQEEILKNSSRTAEPSLYEGALERPPWPTKLETRSHSSSVDPVRKPYDVEREMVTVVLCSTDQRSNQKAWDSLLQRVLEGGAGKPFRHTLDVSWQQIVDHRNELLDLDQEFKVQVKITISRDQNKCVIHGAKDDVSRACSKARILLQMETPLNGENKQRGSQVATSIVSNAREPHGDGESMEENFEDAQSSWPAGGDDSEHRGRSFRLGSSNSAVDNRSRATTYDENVPLQLHHTQSSSSAPHTMHHHEQMLVDRGSEPDYNRQGADQQMSLRDQRAGNLLNSGRDFSSSQTLGDARGFRTADREHAHRTGPNRSGVAAHGESIVAQTVQIHHAQFSSSAQLGMNPNDQQLAARINDHLQGCNQQMSLRDQGAGNSLNSGQRFLSPQSPGDAQRFPAQHEHAGSLGHGDYNRSRQAARAIEESVARNVEAYDNRQSADRHASAKGADHSSAARDRISSSQTSDDVQRSPVNRENADRSDPRDHVADNGSKATDQSRSVPPEINHHQSSSASHVMYQHGRKLLVKNEECNTDPQAINRQMTSSDQEIENSLVFGQRFPSSQTPDDSKRLPVDQENANSLSPSNRMAENRSTPASDDERVPSSSASHFDMQKTVVGKEALPDHRQDINQQTLVLGQGTDESFVFVDTFSSSQTSDGGQQPFDRSHGSQSDRGADHVQQTDLQHTSIPSSIKDPARSERNAEITAKSMVNVNVHQPVSGDTMAVTQDEKMDFQEQANHNTGNPVVQAGVNLQPSNGSPPPTSIASAPIQQHDDRIYKNPLMAPQAEQHARTGIMKLEPSPPAQPSSNIPVPAPRSHRRDNFSNKIAENSPSPVYPADNCTTATDISVPDVKTRSEQSPPQPTMRKEFLRQKSSQSQPLAASDHVLNPKRDESFTPRCEFSDEDWQKRWRELKTSKMRIESIVSDHEKCEKILSRFTAHGGFKVDVKEVERIMNPSLYQRFEQRKSEIRQLVGKPNRSLFYGVPSQFAYDVICTYGWNVVVNDADGNQPRLAPPQFFTTSKQALHDAKPDSQGLKRMILADVIVGVHCEPFGSPAEMKEHSEKAVYHSVANKRDNPTAFTLYSESCAYPVYVVTFID